MTHMEREAGTPGEVGALEESPIPEHPESSLGLDCDSFRMPHHEDLLSPEILRKGRDLGCGNLIYNRPEISRLRGKSTLGAQHPADLLFRKRLPKPGYRGIVAQF